MSRVQTSVTSPTPRASYHLFTSIDDSAMLHFFQHIYTAFLMQFDDTKEH